MEWDVKIGDEITFFDPTLSYELTGYRPIDGVNGLDFDPSWFTKAREAKLRFGNYSDYKFMTSKYRKFWDDEILKMRNGLTVNGYTITGDHYFFLNYYTLKTSNDVNKGGGGRLIGFPSFFVSQYIFFHYFELSRRLFKNCVCLKSRGVGISESTSAILLNAYTSRKAIRCVIAAPDEKKLRPTMKKCNDGMAYLNSSTEKGLRRLRQVKNTEFYRRASHINSTTGEETGWMSEIEGIIADVPDKLRGDRIDILMHEEFGSNKHAEKSFVKGKALIEVNGVKSGIQFGWGTGSLNLYIIYIYIYIKSSAS